MANYVAPVSGTWAAKGSSPFKAARSGGHRYHAGNDLQAANGSPAVAAIGGTVQYAGHNSGYQWNAVILGDDGNAYRYATHGPLTVKEGQRVEAGQQVGTIARSHLHFEVIPPTSPAYKTMSANPGQFVKTSWYPGAEASTINPAEFFGVQAGAEIAAGQPVGSGTPQDAQSAIASLVDPGGGTQVQSPPSPLMAFSPDMPELASAAAPLPAPPPSRPPIQPQPPPSWDTAGAFPPVQGSAGQETMLGGPQPPMPPMRDQAVLDRQRADQLDAALFGSGPHRGDFARGRPEGRWMPGAGGAPDASAVPNPPQSPLAPAVGGPNDRRPQPPTPPSRASGIPNPPPRGTPYAPDFPSLYGEQPAPPAPYSPMVAGRPEVPGSMPAASRTGDMSAAMGGPPAPPPGPDGVVPLFDPGSEYTAGIRLYRPNTPQQPSSSPAPDVSTDQDSRILAREMGRNRSMMEGLTAPPQPTQDFDFTAGPGPTFTPPTVSPMDRMPSGVEGSAQQISGLPPLNGASFPEQHRSGEWFTPAPPMPGPQPDPLAGRFNDAFSPGGGGQIMDLQAAFNRQNAPPAPTPATSPPSLPVGPSPAYADDSWIGGGSGTNPSNGVADTIGSARVVGSPADANFYAPPSRGPGDYTNIEGRYDDAFAGGSDAPGGIGMDTTTPIAGRVIVKADQYGTTPEPAPSPVAQAATMGLPDPPPPPQQEQQRRGLLQRFISGMISGPGLLNKMGGAPSIGWTGASGTAPYGNTGQTTNYRTGTVSNIGNGNSLTPNANVHQWNTTNGQNSVTVVQDPWTGTYYQPTYGSPI